MNALNKRAFITFWLLFILINGLMYFQNYISILNHWGLLQGPTINAGSWTGRVHMLFGRSSYHLFKISGEILLLLSLFFFIKPTQKWPKRILYSTFIFLFVYNVYYEFYQKFYGIIPSFKNDYVLLQEVLPVFLNSMVGNAILYYAATVIATILLAVFFVFLMKKMIKNFFLIRKHKLTQLAFLVLLLFTIIYASVSSYKLEHQNILDTHWLIPKIVKSTSLHEADKFKQAKPSPYKNYLDYPLAEKPNIYLLFIESYGTIVTESPDLKGSYLQQIKGIEKELSSAGYHTASTYSISPVKGGRSWLAFSSFMSGLKVENQIQYNDLIQKNHSFPHMVRYFNKQGYQTYRLSTISNTNSSSLIPYERTNRYWGFDEWWTYWDFKYQGHPYDVLGGIPDQYAMGYYRDVITKDVEKPKLLFFITMGSHMPWFEPPPIVDDWKELNRPQPGKVQSMEGNEIDRYEKSIQYELELMTRFILEESENSIFILVGDHQPPGMEYKITNITHDAATPIHIISKDSMLIQRFNEDGFQKGMEVKLDQLDYLKHEAFYKIFMDNLLDLNN